MLRALSIKLYPNQQQQIYLAQLFGCGRVVYNSSLAYASDLYEKQGKSCASRNDLVTYMHHVLLKDETRTWLKDHNTKILKSELANLAVAFKNFFTKRSNYPKFKSKYDKQSIAICREAISKHVLNNPDKLYISKAIGSLSYRCSKEYKKQLIKHGNDIHSITIVKLPNGDYYGRILLDYDIIRKVLPTDKAVGIDLGVKTFITTSDGEIYENLHLLEQYEYRLKHIQRMKDKKKKGSNNRKKCQRRYAELHNKLRNVKLNLLHYITSRLVNENQVICMEDLNVKGMIKNHHLSKAIQCLNFGEFRQILEYKCKMYGRTLITVSRWYPSSKTCHECGYINKELKLSDREWVCPQCGCVIDRDYNAALNILDEGMRIYYGERDRVGGRSAEFKPVEIPPMDERNNKGYSLKSSESWNQEGSNRLIVNTI